MIFQNQVPASSFGSHGVRLVLQVFLPLLSTVWWAYQRREQALRDLAESEACSRAIMLTSHD